MVPHELALQFTILEQSERGDATDSVTGRAVGVLVHVRFNDSKPAGIVTGESLYRRGHQLAGTALPSPEIHQDRLLGAQNFLLERGIANCLKMFCHLEHLLSLSYASTYFRWYYIYLVADYLPLQTYEASRELPLALTIHTTYSLPIIWRSLRTSPPPRLPYGLPGFPALPFQTPGWQTALASSSGNE